jgi:hypothetical protein
VAWRETPLSGMANPARDATAPRVRDGIADEATVGQLLQPRRTMDAAHSRRLPHRELTLRHSRPRSV